MSMAEATRRNTRPASRPASTSARVSLVAMPPRQRQEALEPPPEAEALEHEEAAVIEPPRHEGPGRAVPEAAEEEDEPEVEVGAGGAVAIAPEGNVEIVAKPRGERDVPPPPEL